MNNENKNTNKTNEDRDIDLLVDGELSDERRRKLLADLDVKPGGWRRCALAFLEDQCWRQTVGSATEDTKRQPTAPLSSPEHKTVERQRRRPGAVARATGVLMAMAASFFFALGLGSMIWNADQSGHLGGPSGGSQQAAMFGATPTNPQDGQLVHDKEIVLPGQYQTVTITDKRPDGTKRSIQLPAVVQSNIDEALLRELPSAIPPELVQAFQKAGHDVHQTRRLVPFRMNDGRRLVVPVDQLDVHYVSTPYYQ